MKGISFPLTPEAKQAVQQFCSGELAYLQLVRRFVSILIQIFFVWKIDVLWFLGLYESQSYNQPRLFK